MGLLLWIFIAYQAKAASSCLPEFTSLQVVEVTSALDQPTTRAYPLKSEGPRGRFETKAILSVTTGPQVDLRAEFDPKFDGVSLAYNLYALQVVRDGEVILWEDFTGDCRGPGLSFFPGRVVRLPSIKLPDDKPHRLHILIWGKL